MAIKLGEKVVANSTIGLSVLACVLHIVGYVTPGWTILNVVVMSQADNGTFVVSYHSSLWYITVCSDTNCLVKPIFDVMKTDNRLNWIYYTITDGIAAYQTETSVALALTGITVVLVIFAFKSAVSDFARLCLLICIMNCSIISGVAALIASITKTRDTFKWKDVYDFTFPFSVLLIGLGGLVNIAALAACIKPLIHIIHVLKKPTSQRQSLMSHVNVTVPMERTEPPPPAYQKVSKSSKYQSGQLRNWHRTETSSDNQHIPNGSRYDRERANTEPYWTEDNRNEPYWTENNRNEQKSQNGRLNEKSSSHSEPYRPKGIRNKRRAHNDGRHEEKDNPHNESYTKEDKRNKQKTPHSGQYEEKDSPHAEPYLTQGGMEPYLSQGGGITFASTRPSSYYARMESQNYAYENPMADSPVESCV